MTNISAHQTPPKVSGAAPLLGHALEFLRNPVPLLERGLAEHGSVFSMQLANKKAVVMLGPEHNAFFFDETDKRLSIRAGYDFFRRMFGDDFYTMADFESYKQQRGILLPRFQAQEMRKYVGIMAYETAQFATRLGKEGSFDLIDEFGPLVMNIAAHSFLGSEFRERLDDEIFADFRLFSEGMDPATPSWVPLLKFKRSRDAKARLDAQFLELMKARRANPVAQEDFFQSLVSAKYKTGGVVPDDILINLIHLMVWAGHETTAGHISWALIDLLQNPTYLEAVYAQQQDVMGNSMRISMQEANALKAIEWGLKETERLHPVAYILIRETLEPIEHAGHLLPKGTLVFISPALSHRLPHIFAEPERFKMDRFANTSAQAQVKHSLVGFGGGMHRCSGVNFAYLEMKVILTLLLQQFDFELVDPKPQAIKAAATKWPASPCRVRYRLKENAPAIRFEEIMAYASRLSAEAECPVDHLNL